MAQQIETRHSERLVVLGCDTCAVRTEIRTLDAGFSAAVASFFERHAACMTRLDLPG